ncbi:PadR family transcriptional regulator [Pseudonocardia sp. ICBG1293]|uniref:PadR family transcriptional regulator n=1 Tax=Pseudonocardia sp. ICBG1293 TaxID=2844382 RepID=UPI001CCAAAFE|nr:helix-turn-helix transcriptional regulator [Pseudonocardia sp. ICBG1293]
MRPRDRPTLDLLLLRAVHAAPGDGAAVLAAVHERSGGAVPLSAGSVHRALHRLERNRLVRRPAGSRGYRLTPLGGRVLRSRTREFEAHVRAVRALLPGGAVTSGAGAGADRAGRVRG